MGKGLSKVPSNKIISYDEREVALGKQNVRAACPKDKLEFQFFSSPAWVKSLFNFDKKKCRTHHSITYSPSDQDLVTFYFRSTKPNWKQLN